MEAELMSEKELAAYLGLSLSTVRRLRYAGEGPPVTWLGTWCLLALVSVRL
jgi:DNA-binding Xre family transcriptional regulator